MNDRLKRLRLSDRAVYAALTAQCGTGGDEMLVSAATLAEREGISLRTVERALGRLAHARLITQRIDGGNRRFVRVAPLLSS